MPIREDLVGVRESLGEIKRQLVRVDSSQALALRLIVQLVERRLDPRDA